MLNWKFYQKGHNIYERSSHPKMGYVYVAKIYVMPKFYITKIGATTDPASRFSNLGRNVKIVCVSRPHFNYFENETILHEFYDAYRVPTCAKNKIRPELFNISLVDIFKTMPSLNFETELSECVPHVYAKGNEVWYSSRNEIKQRPTG